MLSECIRLEFRTGLELGSYRTGDDSREWSEWINVKGQGALQPATGLFDGRGVASRSPALDESLGGELIIMPSLLANCEGGAGVARAGDDWKKRGDDDATAALAAVCLVLRGVA
jgi:hypothetical protein